jgi:hypothetical protein
VVGAGPRKDRQVTGVVPDQRCLDQADGEHDGRRHPGETIGEPQRHREPDGN